MDTEQKLAIRGFGKDFKSPCDGDRRGHQAHPEEAEIGVLVSIGVRAKPEGFVQMVPIHSLAVIDHGDNVFTLNLLHENLNEGGFGIDCIIYDVWDSGVVAV